MGTWEADGEGGSHWPELPLPALLHLFQYLGNEDLVSVGQVCYRWRTLAKGEDQWRRRELWDGSKRALARVLRFAPCLGRLSVSGVSWAAPGDRKQAKRAAKKRVVERALERAVRESDCKVRRLRLDLVSGKDSAWSLQLLQQQVPHLEELWLQYGLERPMLQAVQQSGALRALVLWGKWSCKDLQRRPITFQELPASRSSLECVHMGWLPLLTSFSLLRAHRHTLREASLRVGVPCSGPDNWPETCNHLHLLLRQCRLVALRKLTLHRYKYRHPPADCAAQVAAIREVLHGCVVCCSKCSSPSSNTQ